MQRNVGFEEKPWSSTKLERTAGIQAPKTSIHDQTSTSTLPLVDLLISGTQHTMRIFCIALAVEAAFIHHNSLLNRRPYRIQTLSASLKGAEGAQLSAGGRSIPNLI